MFVQIIIHGGKVGLIINKELYFQKRKYIEKHFLKSFSQKPFAQI